MNRRRMEKILFHGIATMLLSDAQPTTMLGVPVIFDPDSKLFADARGLLFWKRIVIGPSWFTLTLPQAFSVLVHEAGHCLLRHMEKRILALPMLFLRPGFSQRLCAEQEMEADAFACGHGYGEALLSMLQQHGGEPGAFYPSNEERVARLTALIRKENK